jgi:hypothetical protein
VPLPVPENTVRCQIVWALGTQEIAVNTLHFIHQHVTGNNLDWETDMTQRYADLVRDAFKSKWEDIGPSFSGGVSLQRVDAYHLATSGFTLNKKTAIAAGSTAMVGSSAAQMLPYECSLVVSLYGYPEHTYVADAARKRGRIYLPPMTAAALSQGRYASPAWLADRMSQVFAYMQGRVMDNGAPQELGRERARLVILSKKYNSTARVQQVRVDDLFDVQRRRQNNLVPAVETHAVISQDSGPAQN